MYSSEQLTTQICEVVKNEVGSKPITGCETHVEVTAFVYDSNMKQITEKTAEHRVPISSKVFSQGCDAKKQWCFVYNRDGKPTLRAILRNDQRGSKDSRASSAVAVGVLDMSEESVDVTDDLAAIQAKLDALTAQVGELTRLLTSLHVQ